MSRSISASTRRQVLHEGGYKCANPVCRTVLTLEIHHIVPVAEDGSDTADNLVALCPNCHSLHHKGEITEDSIRAWKMLLLSINEAYDRESVDLLLALDKSGPIWVTGDSLPDYSSLVAANLVRFRQIGSGTSWSSGIGPDHPPANVRLTEKGNHLVEEWKNGNQREAIEAMPAPVEPNPDQQSRPNAPSEDGPS